MKPLMKLTVAATTACLLSACASGEDSKEALAKLKNLSPKAAYAMEKDFVAKGAGGEGVDSYKKCTKAVTEYNKNPNDELTKMYYSGSYKSGCEAIFTKVQATLAKRGIQVSLKTVQKTNVAQMLISKHDKYACLQSDVPASYC